MTIFEASFWENAWKDVNEWGKIMKLPLISL